MYIVKKKKMPTLTIRLVGLGYRCGCHREENSKAG